MRVGTTTLDDIPMETYRVVGMDVHPSYKKTGEFDVARLTLQKPLVFRETVRPICMPNATTQPDDIWESATIAGEIL